MKLFLESIVTSVLVLVLICFTTEVNAQQVLLTDDFSAGPGNWTLNTSDQVNGGFTAGGAAENLWIVNNIYAGSTASFVQPTQNQPVGISGAPNSQYLHILGGVFSLATILNCNYNYQQKAGNEMYMARMSNPVNTTGLKDIKFKFWWLNFAEGTVPTGIPPSGQVVYSVDAGLTWLPTGFAMANDSTWDKDSISLPTFSNQASLSFGFLFVNPDTGLVGAFPVNRPAFAVDDVTITGVPSGTPSADFTANPRLVCKGDCVQFTDISSGNPTQWKWSFGTGLAADTSNVQNPSFCFNNVGNFSISLTGTNSLGSGVTNTKTGYIQVVDCNSAPNANFSMNDSKAGTITICAGDSIAFRDSSTGVVNTRYWSFPGAQDDSGKCRLKNDTNIFVGVFYPCAGNGGRDTSYTVTLNVSGTGGADFVTKKVIVKGCVPAKAKIKGENQRKLCKDQCIKLEYDYTVTDEFFISTDSMTLTWYAQGIKTDQWDSNYYSYFVADTSVLNDTYRTDSTLTGDVMNLCYVGETNTILNYDITLVVENIYGKDSVVYEDFVSVMGYPDVNTIYEDSTIVRGHRGFLSTKLGSKGERNYCRDLRDVEKLRGDTCCCFNYYWYYQDGNGKFIRDDIESWDERSTFAEPTSDTYYYVIKENYNGCRVLDSLEIILRKDAGGVQYSVGVPSIFSPGSGRYTNKNFYVFGNGITKINVQIFNRFGQVVYNTESVNDIVIEDPTNQGAKTGWRGTFQNETGKDLTPGVYTYFIQVTHENGDFKELQGNVTLVR